MADDNVSFTDAADGTGAGGAKANANASGMLDLIGNLNEGKKKGKKSKASKEKGGKGKKGKKSKGGKKVRKADKFESQNFLFRIEGTICCASIIIGVTLIVTYLIVFIVFLIWTGGAFSSFIDGWW
ncbi:unnamed protein product [Caenorhabditis angaria]|uniref:Uncharacterized protein n=1 Tax=Caenorhabditis angaria TaxID=860376 RepID=A0A9P1IDN4_9PELO|nr:unnamed protein product [Caenorhabditis angaria]